MSDFSCFSVRFPIAVVKTRAIALRSQQKYYQKCLFSCFFMARTMDFQTTYLVQGKQAFKMQKDK